MSANKWWGGPPGPQPAPWPAFVPSRKTPERSRPGGRLRPRGAAPQKPCGISTTLLVLLAIFAATASAASKVAVGERAPEFSVTTPEDKIVNLSDLRGKRVLIFLWASW